MQQMHSALSEFTLNSVPFMSFINLPRPLFAAVLRRAPANPFGESVREDKRVMVADFVGYGFNGQFSGGKQFGGPAHAQIGDLVHGAATELAPAEPAQVLIAVAGFSREPGQRPGIGQMRNDPLPEHTKLIRLIAGLRKAQHVGVNEVGPLLDQGGLAWTIAL